MPIARAVCKLMTNSNLVDRSSRSQIVMLALVNKIPAAYGTRDTVAVGAGGRMFRRDKSRASRYTNVRIVKEDDLGVL
jgi:hypothetical protein